jgi:hypothetical protein
VVQDPSRVDSPLGVLRVGQHEVGLGERDIGLMRVVEGQQGERAAQPGMQPSLRKNLEGDVGQLGLLAEADELSAVTPWQSTGSCTIV